MSLDVLNQIKQQALALSLSEKEELAAFLAEQLKQTERKNNKQNGQEILRQQRMQWLKVNREQYGGQYVALDGTVLVAVGRTYREANERAIAAGKSDCFVTYLPKPDEVAEWGGWL